MAHATHLTSAGRLARQTRGDDTRVRKQPDVGERSPSSAPAALAIWVEPADRDILVTATDAGTSRPGAPSMLADVRRELDAAVIRQRWFASRAAIGYRDAARLHPDAMPLMLQSGEQQALLTCDLPPAQRRLVEGARPASRDPLTVTRRKPGVSTARTDSGSRWLPIALLATDRSGKLQWTVGALTDDRVPTWPPDLVEPAMFRDAWTTAERLDYDADELLGATRLVARDHPALSTAILSRADHLLAGNAHLLLRLPDTVVIAPRPLARRVAAYSYPEPVRLLDIGDLPQPPCV